MPLTFSGIMSTRDSDRTGSARLMHLVERFLVRIISASSPNLILRSIAQAMRLRTMLCIALRRMAASDGRGSGHPSRRKPSPYGRRLAPQDEVGEPGNDWFHGIARLVRSFPQLEALDLAGGGFRQGIHDLDPARI